MNFIIVIIYEIILWGLALIALPQFLYQYLVHKKYRNSILEKFGLKSPVFKDAKGPLIWIHAVSMGETKAVTTLAREIKRMIPLSHIVISSATETGHAEAKRSLSFADQHIYLPFDFGPIVSRIVKRAAPKLVILSESDLWFNFLRSSKEQGAVIALVNGKISERSTSRFKKIRFFSDQLFSLFDTICAQNTLYQKRLVDAGAPIHKITITGNLKFDEEYPQLSLDEVKRWRQKLGIGPDQPVLTVGSTHDPEEQMLLQHLNVIWKSFPDLKVILVPRHPERFKHVGSLLDNARLNWISFTNIKQRKGDEKVILIDAMGMLRMCYQLSDVALVAGSFTSKVGGHNILEPCWYGKPVLFGPHMHSQLELVDIIHQYQAGEQIEEEDLQEVIVRLLEAPKHRQILGENGLRLVSELRGSTQKTLEALEPLLEEIRA